MLLAKLQSSGRHEFVSFSMESAEGQRSSTTCIFTFDGELILGYLSSIAIFLLHKRKVAAPRAWVGHER